jgi:hypothetical protein
LLGQVTFVLTETVKRRNVRHAAVICASTVVLIIAYGALVVTTTGPNLFGVS